MSKSYEYKMTICTPKKLIKFILQQLEYNILTVTS